MCLIPFYFSFSDGKKQRIRSSSPAVQTGPTGSKVVKSSAYKQTNSGVGGVNTSFKGAAQGSLSQAAKVTNTQGLNNKLVP